MARRRAHTGWRPHPSRPWFPRSRVGVRLANASVKQPSGSISRERTSQVPERLATGFLRAGTERVRPALAACSLLGGCTVTAEPRCEAGASAEAQRLEEHVPRRPRPRGSCVGVGAGLPSADLMSREQERYSRGPPQRGWLRRVRSVGLWPPKGTHVLIPEPATVSLPVKGDLQL